MSRSTRARSCSALALQDPLSAAEFLSILGKCWWMVLQCTIRVVVRGRVFRIDLLLPLHLGGRDVLDIDNIGIGRLMLICYKENLSISLNMRA